MAQQPSENSIHPLSSLIQTWRQSPNLFCGLNLEVEFDGEPKNERPILVSAIRSDEPESSICLIREVPSEESAIALERAICLVQAFDSEMTASSSIQFLVDGFLVSNNEKELVGSEQPMFQLPEVLKHWSYLSGIGGPSTPNTSNFEVSSFAVNLVDKALISELSEAVRFLKSEMTRGNKNIAEETDEDFRYWSVNEEKFTLDIGAQVKIAKFLYQKLQDGDPIAHQSDVITAINLKISEGRLRNAFRRGGKDLPVFRKLFECPKNGYFQMNPKAKKFNLSR